jgi:hypothetical protein
MRITKPRSLLIWHSTRYVHLRCILSLHICQYFGRKNSRQHKKLPGLLHAMKSERYISHDSGNTVLCTIFHTTWEWGILSAIKWKSEQYISRVIFYSVQALTLLITVRRIIPCRLQEVERYITRGF